MAWDEKTEGMRIGGEAVGPTPAVDREPGAAVAQEPNEGPEDTRDDDRAPWVRGRSSRDRVDPWGEALLKNGKRVGLLNQAFALTAAVGILVGGWLTWTATDTRLELAAACDGLVPAGEVLAGLGALRPGSSWPDGEDYPVRETGGKCALFAGGNNLIFETEWNAAGADPSLDPGFDEQPGIAAPLGHRFDGTVDSYGAVGVLLQCSDDADGNARTLYAKSAFGNHYYPRPDLRGRAARVAVGTVNSLAERMGCSERLPTPPSATPAGSRAILPTSEARDTCAWIRPLAGSEGFLNLTQAVPVSPENSVETCRVFEWDPRGDHPRHGERLSFHSWFGPYAEKAGFPGRGVRDRVHGDRVVMAPPGTAGRVSEPGLHAWWATSTCDGRPAVHLLRGSRIGEERESATYRRAFRAYVEEVTDRRGCTGLKFPASKEFDPGGWPDR